MQLFITFCLLKRTLTLVMTLISPKNESTFSCTQLTASRFMLDVFLKHIKVKATLTQL